MDIQNITVLSGDDWSGIYVNGVLKYENHSLHSSDIFNALDLKVNKIYIEGEDNWDHLNCSCPSTLAELESKITEHNIEAKRYQE